MKCQALTKPTKRLTVFRVKLLPLAQEQITEVQEITLTIGRKPSLLLHSCCAPCSSAVLEVLAPLFSISLYYYNPNIHPETEYRRRLDELRTFAGRFRRQQILHSSKKIITRKISIRKRVCASNRPCKWMRNGASAVSGVTVLDFKKRSTMRRNISLIL